MKRETESLIVAAQNQSIRTSLVKAKIEESQKETPCKADGSTDHVAFGCSKLPEKDYERSHDNLGEIVYWKLARKCSFNAGDDCCEDELESFSENKDYKILWSFSIQTGHVLKTQRQDLVAVDKKRRTFKIIDFVVLGDSGIDKKEKDKIEKYQDLRRELQILEDLEYENDGYTIGCGLFRCYS